MSDRAPEFPTPSPYLTWLSSLSPEDRAYVRQEAERLLLPLQSLLMGARCIQPGVPLGVWLQALRMVWESLEQQLAEQSHHPSAS